MNTDITISTIINAALNHVLGLPQVRDYVTRVVIESATRTDHGDLEERLEALENTVADLPKDGAEFDFEEALSEHADSIVDHVIGGHAFDHAIEEGVKEALGSSDFEDRISQLEDQVGSYDVDDLDTSVGRLTDFVEDLEGRIETLETRRDGEDDTEVTTLREEVSSLSQRLVEQERRTTAIMTALKALAEAVS